jgi:hypothetical protein
VRLTRRLPHDSGYATRISRHTMSLDSRHVPRITFMGARLNSELAPHYFFSLNICFVG